MGVREERGVNRPNKGGEERNKGTKGGMAEGQILREGVDKTK